MPRIGDTRPTRPPAFGATAPDLELPDDTGEPVRFSDRWAAAPRGLILVFVRQLG